MPYRSALHYLIAALLFFVSSFISAQETPVEKSDAKIDRVSQNALLAKEEKPKRKWSSSLELLSGYDSNARLGRVRKGDMFEEVVYSLSYNEPFLGNWRLNMNYNIDATNYHDINDISYVLNYVRIGLNNALNKYLIVGIGCDLSYFYYPNDETNTFLFPKISAFLRNKWTQNTYQQIQVQTGIKQYLDNRAIAYTLSSEQDVERQDDRQSFEYTWATLVTRKLFFKMRLRYSTNDSNAEFQDYYDYEMMDITPMIVYRISKKISLDGRLSFANKNYQRREIFGGSEIQEDDLYVAALGLRYALNEKNSLTLSYNYNHNSSNDPIAEYTSSGVSFGWRYNF